MRSQQILIDTGHGHEIVLPAAGGRASLNPECTTQDRSLHVRSSHPSQLRVVHVYAEWVMRVQYLARYCPAHVCSDCSKRLIFSEVIV